MSKRPPFDELYTVIRSGHECDPDGRNGHLDGAVIARQVCGAVYRARANKDDFGVIWTRLGPIRRWWWLRSDYAIGPKRQRAEDIAVEGPEEASR